MSVRGDGGVKLGSHRETLGVDLKDTASWGHRPPPMHSQAGVGDTQGLGPRGNPGWAEGGADRLPLSPRKSGLLAPL